MKLTEKRWGGYKGKYKNHKVEIDMYQSNDYKYGYRIIKEDTHVFTSAYSGIVFDTKEHAREAAIEYIDNMIK
ncbi:hypothetical protein [Paenibacillus elgii]|uniref:hypothetical protein n=1 Tax=Paenibacillus elgii TaxID=189691 RepID=UPI000248D649|nr:hypothetical protein [Paenibacillus elgii]